MPDLAADLHDLDTAILNAQMRGKNAIGIGRTFTRQAAKQRIVVDLFVDNLIVSYQHIDRGFELLRVHGDLLVAARIQLRCQGAIPDLMANVGSATGASLHEAALREVARPVGRIIDHLTGNIPFHEGFALKKALKRPSREVSAEQNRQLQLRVTELVKNTDFMTWSDFPEKDPIKASEIDLRFEQVQAMMLSQGGLKLGKHDDHHPPVSPNDDRDEFIHEQIVAKKTGKEIQAAVLERFGEDLEPRAIGMADQRYCERKGVTRIPRKRGRKTAKMK